MLYLIPSQLPVQHSAYSLLRSMCSIQIWPVFSPYCSHYGYTEYCYCCWT